MEWCDEPCPTNVLQLPSAFFSSIIDSLCLNMQNIITAIDEGIFIQKHDTCGNDN